MIGLAYMAWTSTARVLAEILMTVRMKPVKKRATISAPRIFAMPSKNRRTEAIMQAAVTVRLLPNLVTSQEEKRRPVTCPTGTATSTVPHEASLSPSFCCTSGILEDHVAVMMPERKKKTAVVFLCFLFSSSCMEQK